MEDKRRVAIDKFQLLEYFLNRQLKWSSNRTVMIREKDLSEFLNAFDPLRVSSKEIFEWLLKQRDKRSKSVLIRKLRNLKVFYRFLVDEGYAKENPAQPLKEPRLPIKGKRLAFSKAQLGRIIECAEAPCVPTRDRAIFFLLLTSGLYSSELCRIKKGNVDLASRILYVRGSRKRGKRVPFSGRAKKYMKKYLSEDIMSSSEYFFHRDSGERLRYLSIYNIVSDVIARAFPRPDQWSKPLGGHILRHTFISLWLRNGGSCDALKEMLFSPYEIRTYAKGVERTELLKREFKHFGKQLRVQYGL